MGRDYRLSVKNKKGSVLILILAVVSLILVLGTTLIIVNTSTYKVQTFTDTVSRVNYMAESGIEVALANVKNENNIDVNSLKPKLNSIAKTLKSEDGDIWIENLDITEIPSDVTNVSSYQIVSTATNGKITKTLYYKVKDDNSNGGNDSHSILSTLFSTKRKFIIGNVNTNTDSDNLDFVVKPGKDKKDPDEKFLFLNSGQYQKNFDDIDYSFNKKKGSSSGIKTTANNFFVFPDYDCTLSGIKLSSNNKWMTYPGTDVQYYVSSEENSSLSISDSSLTNTSSDEFTQGLKNNKDKVRVIIINGNITFNKINASDANTYLNNLIIYCTGTININGCDIETGANGNGNGNSDINICFIGNNLNVQGSNIVRYVDGNDFSSSDETIKKIIGENITSDITWK